MPCPCRARCATKAGPAWAGTGERRIARLGRTEAAKGIKVPLYLRNPILLLYLYA